MEAPMDRVPDFSDDDTAFSADQSVSEEPAGASPAPLRGQLLRFAGSWLGFSGLYAASGGAACPFCGQSTCPAGFLGAGIVGGVLAFGLQAWRRLQK